MPVPQNLSRNLLFGRDGAGDRFLLLDGAEQGRHGGRAVLDRAYGKDKRDQTENGRGRAGVIYRRPGGKQRKEQEQHYTDGRGPGPYTKPDELPARSMLFDDH